MKTILVKEIKRLMGTIEWLFAAPQYAKDELLVLCYHSTPENWMGAFETQVSWLKQKGFKLLAPSDLDRFYQGGMTDGPYVLFTFDDGLANNHKAAKLLERHGTRAYFFLVPGFMETSVEEQPAYYQQNLRPIIDESFEPLEERRTMRISEVASLIERDHAIGAHTYTHTLEATETDQAIIHYEVIDSGKRLTALFDQKINAFCSINQTDISVNKVTAKLIKDNYTYHFSTFPGVNTPNDSRTCIYRRNAEVNWSMGEFKYALGKWMLKRWQTRIADSRSKLEI